MNRKIVVCYCWVALFFTNACFGQRANFIFKREWRTDGILTTPAAAGTPIKLYLNGKEIATLPGVENEQSLSNININEEENTIELEILDDDGTISYLDRGKRKLKEASFGGQKNSLITVTLTGPLIFNGSLAKFGTKVSVEKVECLSMQLDTALKSKVIKESPPIRVARGTEKTVEDTLKITHSVSVTKGWKADLELQGKVTAAWLQLGANIKGGIEKSTNKTYGVETEQKRGVTLKGDGASKKIKVVWVEYYRTGKARVKIGDKEIEVPFEFKEDFDLLTEEVD